MTWEINRSTPAYKRITIAGFNINKIDVVDSYWGDSILRAMFTCVCGRVEYLQVNLADLVPSDKWSWVGELPVPWVVDKLVDVAAIIEHIGAISEGHLRADGFTEEEIKHIRRAYEPEYCEAA